tara:strand:- start:62 stop:532 length:471 start_codon:yes stop_codon:yes gene_type:complete
LEIAAFDLLSAERGGTLPLEKRRRGLNLVRKSAQIWVDGNFPSYGGRGTVAWEDYGILREAENLLTNRAEKQSSVPVRKVGASKSSIRKKGVATEKFLEKCHVEHKRIWRVSGNGPKLKGKACEVEPRCCRIEDLVDVEFFNTHWESPFLKNISQL